MADNRIDSAPRSASGAACVIGVGGGTGFPSASAQMLRRSPEFADPSNGNEPMRSPAAAGQTA